VADFWLSETIIFFFRECVATAPRRRFAIPVSLSFVPGFHNYSFVDQNNR